MKCPYCKGKGSLKEPKNVMVDLKLREKMVKDLRKKGYSFREICLITGYKSYNSVTKILKK